MLKQTKLLLVTTYVNSQICNTLASYAYLRCFTEADLEPNQASKMELLAWIVNGCCQSLTIIPKSSILDVWLGSEYASASVTQIDDTELLVRGNHYPNFCDWKAILTLSSISSSWKFSVEI